MWRERRREILLILEEYAKIGNFRLCLLRQIGTGLPKFISILMKVAKCLRSNSPPYVTNKWSTKSQIISQLTRCSKTTTAGMLTIRNNSHPEPAISRDQEFMKLLTRIETSILGDSYLRLWALHLLWTATMIITIRR